jgi:ferric-dicitrate binding protein FerR (iron transport regulator)
MTKKSSNFFLAKFNKKESDESFTLLTGQGGNIDVDKEKELRESIDTEKAYCKVKSIIKQRETRKKTIYLNSWRAAACIAAVVVSVLLFINNPLGEKEIQSAQNIPVSIDSTLIILSLSDGTIATINKQDPVVVKGKNLCAMNINGVLTYRPSPRSKDDQYSINTITTPIGKDYKVILNDGSEVWMNAGSRLSFPTLFNENNRMVFLEGEAFFKVKNTADNPFTVKTENMDVRVLGTCFNIRAYKDENVVHTTLVEGSVIVKNSGSSNFSIELKPDEQYLLDLETMGEKVRTVDANFYTAWMSNMFVFKNKTLKEVLYDLNKWYGFNYEFVDHDAEEIRISGNIERYKGLDEVLGMIEELNKVNIIKLSNKYMITSKK